MNELTTFSLSPKIKKMSYLGIFMGAICFILGLYVAPERAWVNYLVDVFYFVSLALGGIFFVALQHVSNAGWARVLIRIPEAFGRFLPIGLILTLGLIFGMHSLYEWTHLDVVAKDALLQHKAPYLNISFFFIRVVIVFALWMIFSKLMIGLSHKQDKAQDDSLNSKITKYSAIFLITLGFGYSVFSFDLVMSLEPHWFSTIFALYTFSGLFVASLAAIIVAIIMAQGMGYFKMVNENHFHDLGKLLFSFSTFWAYIWLSQYLLIWYANIPEETAYFYLRGHYTWDWLFYANFIINWGIPFFALLSRNSKRTPFILLRVSILILVGRWLDIYLMVAPNVFKHANITNPQISWLEIGMALGFAGLFILVLEKGLKKAPLIPKNDAYLDESINLHQ